MTTDRPTNLLALDHLCHMGHRSYRNPFLRQACEIFFSPFGLSAAFYEIAISECARGNSGVITAFSPRWNRSNVSPALQRWRLLVDAGDSVEVSVDSDLTLRAKIRGGAAKDELYTQAARNAIESGLVAELNGDIMKAAEYLRDFLGRAVLVLGADDFPQDLLDKFLADPATFATDLAFRFAATTDEA